MWRIRRGCFLLMWSVAALMSVVPLVAGHCREFKASVAEKISGYISERFELAPDLMIEDQGTVSETCFRRLSVTSKEPKRIFTLFLSPDQRFVSPDLMDLTHDLASERRREGAVVSRLLSASPSPTRGDHASDVIIVVFSDFQCPYCKQLNSSLDQVMRNESFRLVFKHYPLENHDWARQAAIASNCAFQQSNAGFWKLHDSLFLHQRQMSRQLFDKQVRDLASQIPEINMTAFESCIDSKPTALSIDSELAQSLHISETPTVFVNGRRKSSVISPADVELAIAEARRAIK